jgi:hypothetical protein
MTRRTWVGWIGIVGVAACAGSEQMSSAPSPEAGSDVGSVTPSSVVSEAAPDSISDADANDFYACSQPGDCTLVPFGCCWGYAVPEWYTAITAAKATAWAQAWCPQPAAVGCDASIVPFGGLAAFCIEGRCREIVLAKDPISACEKDGDCVAVPDRCREATQCEWLGADVLRADHLATYAAQTCPDKALPAPCTSSDLDAGVFVARCGADKHCTGGVEARP